MTDQQSAVLAPRGDAPSGRPEAESPARKWTQSLSLGRYTGVVVALLVVAIYLTITEPVFLTWDNLMNIVKSNSVIFVLAIGATFVVISGGIDLSTASATTATAMIFGLALHADWALVPALAAAIGFGLMIGLINGVLITKAHISFLVVTLGALSIWASFALVVNDGQTVSVFTAPAFGPIKDFVNKDVGPIPILLIFDAILRARRRRRPALHGVRTRAVRDRLQPGGRAPQRHQHLAHPHRGLRDRGPRRRPRGDRPGRPAHGGLARPSTRRCC